MFFALMRPVRVTLTLLPFIVSFLRDWKGHILWGEPRPLSDEQHRERARRLTRSIGTLGPAFIKLFQVLSMREDFLPKVYCDEFKTLQDRLPAFPYPRVRETIRRALGRQPEEIFEHFSHRPIAAASLGQVHVARYQGRKVAVKVIRPNVRRIVAVDGKVMMGIIATLHVLIDHYVVRSLLVMVREFRRVIAEEMDFQTELRHARRFRSNLAAVPGLVVPEVIEELCTSDTFVLEFFEGRRIDDAEWLKRHDLDYRTIVERLILCYSRQVLVDGFLHADPHPGNLLVNQHGQIAILDYGMALEISPFTKEEIARLALALVRRDMDGVIRGMFALGMVEPDVGMSTLRDAAALLMEINLGTGASPRQIQRIAEDILRTFYKFPLRMPSELVYLFRATSLLEGIGLSFDPNFNALRVGLPILKRQVKDLVRGEDRSWFDLALGWARRTGDVLLRLERLVDRADREEFRVRAHPADLHTIEQFFTVLLRRILAAFLSLAAGSALFFWYVTSGNKMLLAAGIAIPLATILLLILLPIRRKIRWD
ncbi:MAG: AarF/ABC1/UbiB kinase family protein [Candidatus Sumerlaeia bacterium]